MNSLNLYLTPSLAQSKYVYKFVAMVSGQSFIGVKKKRKKKKPTHFIQKERRVNTKTTILSIYVWSSDSYTNKQSNYLLIKGNSKVNWCSIFQPFINRAWLWFNELEYSPLVM